MTRSEVRTQRVDITLSIPPSNLAVSERGQGSATGRKQDEASRSRPPTKLNLLGGLSQDEIDRLHDRFDTKWRPDPNTGCHLWTGAISSSGYGCIALRGKSGTNVNAHRLSYEFAHGPVPEGMDIDHTCRTRSCVNAAHLEPVSHRENMRRGGGFAGLNAAKTHCKRGHAFTPENTRPHGKGNRACRQCEQVRRVSRRPDAVIASLGLSHPAITSLPQELISPPQGSSSVTGERRVAGKSSAYVAPIGARAERRGHLEELTARLCLVRRGVAGGSTIVDEVADGTLMGWRAREALSNVLGEPVVTWDSRGGRTNLERVAVVERALAELGHQYAPPRRGGWSISSVGK